MRPSWLRWLWRCGDDAWQHPWRKGQTQRGCDCVYLCVWVCVCCVIVYISTLNSSAGIVCGSEVLAGRSVKGVKNRK